MAHLKNNWAATKMSVSVMSISAQWLTSISHNRQVKLFEYCCLPLWKYTIIKDRLGGGLRCFFINPGLSFCSFSSIFNTIWKSIDGVLGIGTHGLMMVPYHGAMAAALVGSLVIIGNLVKLYFLNFSLSKNIRILIANSCANNPSCMWVHLGFKPMTSRSCLSLSITTRPRLMSQLGYRIVHILGCWAMSENVIIFANFWCFLSFAYLKFQLFWW